MRPSAGRSVSMLLAVLLIAAIAAACGPAAVESIGFGTGGQTCTLANEASSFASGVPVQFVSVFTPELPAGDTVNISLTQDGRDRPDLSGTVHLDVAQNCIGGVWRTLSAGHYRVVIESASDTGMPALAGEFDVTP